MMAVKNVLNANWMVYRFLKSILDAFGYHSYKMKQAYENYKIDEKWKSRIKDVLSCPDTDHIPRVPDAGVIKGACQIMHNGLKVKLGSYYSFGVTEMLRLSRGIHEPQEERVFMEVLKQMPENAVMIELGSYWAFYSMWFYQSVKNGVCYLIEPDKIGLDSGKKNFKLNNMKGHFFNAFVSSKSSKNNNDTPAVCIDDFVSSNNIPFIHILHSDIQGYELEMLKGSQRSINEKKIGYLFISTHSNELHNQCISFLKENHFIILASANMDESYSVDGLIVARSFHFKGINPVNISLKRNPNNAN